MTNKQEVDSDNRCTICGEQICICDQMYEDDGEYDSNLYVQHVGQKYLTDAFADRFGKQIIIEIGEDCILYKGEKIYPTIKEADVLVNEWLDAIVRES